MVEFLACLTREPTPQAVQNFVIFNLFGQFFVIIIILLVSEVRVLILFSVSVERAHDTRLINMVR